mgnify:CR=1 FL=1
MLTKTVTMLFFTLIIRVSLSWVTWIVRELWMILTRNLITIFINWNNTLRVKYIDDGPNDPQDLSSYNVTINAEPGDALNYDTKGSIAELVIGL